MNNKDQIYTFKGRRAASGKHRVRTHVITSPMHYCYTNFRTCAKSFVLFLALMFASPIPLSSGGMD